ncbi:hypothetical protein NLG97_g6221 [Lecanicillium saksenae]|uniref:Uncharacterized protein n=1 Tax=Lecanicillium saksenae TaxID=468837 RepID=A0ACC1QQT8_9HYPO|nr:hypothetical protein NLG97_g6221 [Lecanicillium saksenae]
MFTSRTGKPKGGPQIHADVVLLRNGTTLNLAKVDGDADYQASMERRPCAGRFGASTLDELETVFIPTLRTLKERSEAMLQRRIEDVHYATPWITELRKPNNDEDDSFVVGQSPGLTKPFSYDGITLAYVPMHVNEANAVMAASGRMADIEARILSYVTPWHLMTPTFVKTILISGEAAATNPDFSVRGAVGPAKAPGAAQQHRRRPRLMDHDYYGHQHVRGIDSMEIVVAEDGVFDAAKGAAMWMRTNFWGFCDDVDIDAMDLASQEHYEKNGVKWPSFFSED